MKHFSLFFKFICIHLLIVLMLPNFAFANIDDDETIDINEIKAETIETSSTVDDTPKLSSRVALIYDRASKTILFEKNGQKQVPMASTTKIMTAIIVLESANLKDVVVIGKKAAGTGGSRLGLKENDKITVHDLLYGLMLKSGNDAAVALAVHVGGSVEGFANMMNQKAKQLGCNNSHFVTPHGLDQKEHYTTAYELAVMADYALNIQKFHDIVGTKTYNIIINGQSRTIANTNELLGILNGVYGVKTGFTNGAGRCLVTACKRNNLDIITVVLGADTKKIRTQDSIKLIEYAYKNYQVVEIEKIVTEKFEEWKQINEKRISINKGVTSFVSLTIEKLPYSKIAIKNTEVDNIEIAISCLYNLEAPILKNEQIGILKIKVKDTNLQNLAIKVENDISKKQVLNYFLEFLKLMP